MLTATATFAQPCAKHRIADALRREWGDAGSAVKTAARICRIPPGTFQNFWQGRNAPNADDLISLMAASSQLKAEVAAMVAEREALIQLCSIPLSPPSSVSLMRPDPK